MSTNTNVIPIYFFVLEVLVSHALSKSNQSKRLDIHIASLFFELAFLLILYICWFMSRAFSHFYNIILNILIGIKIKLFLLSQ